MPSNLARAAAVLCALALTNCTEQFEPTGPTERESRTIPLDNNQAVRVRLHMGAGELQVQGGSSNLLDANFEYNVPAWKPRVRYSTLGSRADLDVEQPDTGHLTGAHGVYRWDLALNDNASLRMELNFGAGQGDLKLGSLNLEGLDVNMGVGQLMLDLRGEPRQEYDVNVHGGVGELTVYLPHAVGIEASAHGGIGEIVPNGLYKRGSRYVNEAYESGAKRVVHLSITGGIGSITLNAS